MEYPFKKIHNREFASIDLISLVQSFNLLIDEQNGDSNHSNSNVTVNNLIDIDRNAQQSNWKEQQSLQEKVQI